jgi:hypothetical protein
MTNETLSIALIGTSRSGAADIALPTVAQDAVAQLPAASPERTLLNRTAILFACEACGIKPAAAGERVPACPPDQRPSCSALAANILQDLLSSNAHDLIGEWLDLANAAARRPPHRLLPALLDYAGKHSAHRQRIAAVVDRRGEWLMSLNPDWQFAAPVDAAPDDLWQTGTHAQRIDLLRTLRGTEPARARDLIAATWKDESAEQRTEFVAGMLLGLSNDDEPFLETALDDRSKLVRAAAADLLARLPESQLVRRMIDRVTPLLIFNAGAPGSMLRLKKSSAARLDVELPKQLDKSMQRDGIEEKAANKGQKQWWLEQMLGMVPPAHWSRLWNLPPHECVALAAGDHASALLDGWSKACERYPAAEWIEPLLRRGFTDGNESSLNRTLLGALPAQRFLGFAVDALRSKNATLSMCSDLINSGNVPLDVTAGRVFVQTVADRAIGGNQQDVSILWHMIEQCATRLPPSLCDEIASKWNVEREPWSSYKRQVESLLATLDIRRRMQNEFK